MGMSLLGCNINILALAIALLLYRVAKCSCFVFCNVLCSVFIYAPAHVKHQKNTRAAWFSRPNYHIIPKCKPTATKPPPSDRSVAYYVFHFVEALPPVTRETVHFRFTVDWLFNHFRPISVTFVCRACEVLVLSLCVCVCVFCKCHCGLNVFQSW